MPGTSQKSPTRVDQVVRELRRQVAQGRWDTGQKIDSEHALAERHGVSRGTIATALRELARDGLLRSEHGRGWFVNANPIPRTGVIAVVFPDLSLIHCPMPRYALFGAQTVLEEAGHRVWLSAMPSPSRESGKGPPSKRDWMDMLDPAQIDGVIIATREVLEERALALADHVPTVWLAPPAMPPRIGGAQPDFLGGAFDAAAHLVGLGHRRIGLVTVERSFTQGWEQAEGALLGMRGLLASGEGELRTAEAEWNHPEHGQAVAQELLAAPDRPTAVIAGSDELALGVWRAMQKLGLRMPEDVSVTGWNDVMAPDAFPVPMTTVAQVAERVGAAAARQLLGMIAQSGRSVQTQRVPMPFIVRESTAPPVSR